MYKFDVKSDYENLENLLRYNKPSNFYDTVYFKSNEHVREILSNFDIKGKDVLTVLGSGDQAFHFHNSDAKSVDVFDINRLAIYYHYLRIWMIKYLNIFYRYDFNAYSWYELTKKLKTTYLAEHQASRFWDLFFGNNNTLNKIFEYDPTKCNNEISDLSKLQQKYNDLDIVFHNIDITKHNLRLNKKYDIIYTSNISDWLFDFDDNFSEERMIDYRNNLKRLLKDNGIVICAHAYQFYEYEDETEIFSKYFDRYTLDEIEVCEGSESPGYYYVKK